MDPRTNSPANSSRNTEDPDDAGDLEMVQNPTIITLAAEAELDSITNPSHASLSKRLAFDIQKVSRHLRLSSPKRYSYEEWVEFTRLIRLTRPERLNRDLGRVTTENEDENEEGLVNWDWIGDDSPMVSEMSESEWLLERLCESLIRLERRRDVTFDGREVVKVRTVED